jgi:hypothetical protein
MPPTGVQGLLNLVGLIGRLENHPTSILYIHNFKQALLIRKGQKPQRWRFGFGLRPFIQQQTPLSAQEALFHFGQADPMLVMKFVFDRIRDRQSLHFNPLVYTEVMAFTGSRP